MKDIGWMVAMVTASTTTAVVLGLVTVVVLRENHGLREDLRASRQQSEQATDQARQLDEERTSAEEALADHRQQVAQLEAELSAHHARAVSNPPAANLPLRATRLGIYSGGRYLGDSWFVPAATSPEAFAAGLQPRPMVLLDESVRAVLADSSLRRPENSEADPTRTVYVNYQYNPYPGWVWWPGYGYLPGTNAAPTQPAPRPSTPQYPPQPSPFLSTKFYRPTEKPFLPVPAPYPGMTPPSTRPLARASTAPVPPVTVFPAARPSPLPRSGAAR